MKMLELRKSVKEKFKANFIDVCDADFIIAELLNIPRTELNLINEFPNEKMAELNRCVELRLTGMPVDKIFNKAYFFGLEFKVNEDVLSPRADSEVLIETALKHIKQNAYKTVLDLCCGSGCLAISIKKNADVLVTAIDISQKALSIAKFNAKQLDAEIEFVRSDMFEKIDGKFDLIVSNPPYIPTEEIAELDDEVKCHDPHLALDGGDFGLKFYNIIHNNLRKFLNKNGMLIIEIGEDQKPLISSMFADLELIETVKDLNGIERVLVFKLKGEK